MRSLSLLTAVLLVSIIFSYQSLAQSTALPFLLITSSTRANAMGETDVADHTDDPFAPISNPAQLGMISRTNYFSSAYDHADWLPAFQLDDLKYSAYAANVGLDLRQINPDAPALTLGFGYSNVHLSLGKFVLTSEEDPEQIGTFDAWENSDQYSLGLGYENWVRVSAGMSVKYVHSQLAPINGGTGKGTATLYDYGFLLDIPVIDIASRVTRQPIELTSGLSPYLDWSIGLAQNNVGKESITYDGQNQKDALPRYARAGIAFDLGLALKTGGSVWKPLSFKWTVEAADVRVVRDSTGAFSYQSGLGDINFLDEVILGKTNIKTEKKKGWEVGFMEFASIRGGRFEEDPAYGGRRLKTSGWGLRFAGFAKMLRALSMQNESQGVVRFILHHIDVRYDHSEWTPDDLNSALAGTKFDSIGLSILM